MCCFVVTVYQASSGYNRNVSELLWLICYVVW